jgi:hypothetical protein
MNPEDIRIRDQGQTRSIPLRESVTHETLAQRTETGPT